jgi:eukaryotic-like serine/threonine-protein kinase
MTECPSTNHMRAFLADALDANATAAAEAHVEACSRCQGELDRLTSAMGPADKNGAGGVAEQPLPGNGSAAAFLRRLEREAPSIAPAAPSPPDVRGIADRNLLFGVLAMQVDLIEPGQFADVCSAWATRKHVPLADLMVERGWLTPADKDEVERLLLRKLKRHKGDAAAGLAEVASPDIVRSLGDVHDDEIHRSLAALPPAAGRVFLSTTNFELGTRERYSLSRLHARGGIGRVWLAQDVDLGREVALKELLPGQANQPQACARFLAEAKITGQLEHPGIVPVYELSRRPNGQEPFYTMRFIKGRTLTEASKEYHVRRAAGHATTMDLRELLSAFVAVSYAVAYAHSRGVIHRDLKGQNVILGKYGEVIVLDWGLAKMVGGPDDERPNISINASLPVALAAGDSHDQTLQGQVLGTPAYMAPEQAQGRQDLVDQRTDVYGLGAILYEILAGEAPFCGGDTRDLLQRVVNEVPARPRNQVPATAPALEAICLKAMAKKPGDRYSTARALGQDVQKFLADEPVAAYPERWTVSLSRWGRRHRSLVGGAAALLIVGVAALTVTTVLLGQANRRTQVQRDEAERHRGLADQAAAEARAVNDFLTEDLLGQADPDRNSPKKQITVEELLRKAEARIDRSPRFAAMPWIEASLHYTIAKTYAKLGLNPEAERHFRRAMEIRREFLGPDHPETLAAQEALADFLNIAMQRPAESEPLAKQTWEARSRVLGPEHRDTLDSLDTYAVAVGLAGRKRAAADLSRQCLNARKATLGLEDEQTLLSMNNLAVLLVELGDYDESVSLIREAVTVRRKQVGPPSELIANVYNLVNTLYLAGNLEEADKLVAEFLDKAVETLGPESPAVDLMSGIAVRVWVDVGRLDNAIERGGKVLANRRKKHATGHYLIGAILLDLGRAQAAQGKFEVAMSNLDEAYSIIRDAPQRHAHFVYWALTWRGVCLTGLERYAEAEPLLIKAEEGLRESISTPTRHYTAAVEHLATLYEKWGRPNQAAEWRNKIGTDRPARKP